MPHPPTWEPLLPEDLPRLVDLAGRIHSALPERVEIFTEKLALFPDGARKLTDGAAFLGYAIAHPWTLFSIPALDGFLEQLPAHPDCLHAHDMVVAPAARGASASAHCLAYWKEIALGLGLRAITGVSVYGTDAHWSRFGFRVVSRPDLPEKLAHYGSTAKYMVWTL